MTTIRDLVVGATSEDLSQADWALILDICDRVENIPNGPRECLLAISKRIAHPKYKVVLNALTLVEALVKNCGVSVQHEISSRQFTEVLIKKLNNSSTPGEIKSKILELVQYCTDTYKNDPTLAYMEDVRNKLAVLGHSFALDVKPRPSRPKNVERDREQAEAEDLELAIALSLSEQSSQSKSTLVKKSTPKVPLAPPPTTTLFKVKALYNFGGAERGELAFRIGDIIAITDADYEDWWMGTLRGASGLIPSNYVERYDESARRSLDRPEPNPAANEPRVEAVKEIDVLLGEAGKVSQLLQKLDNLPPKMAPSDDPEIQALYSQALNLRPSLLSKLQEYTDLKDKLLYLNGRLAHARGTYDRLMEEVLRNTNASNVPYGRPPDDRPPTSYQGAHQHPPQGQHHASLPGNPEGLQHTGSSTLHYPHAINYNTTGSFQQLPYSPPHPAPQSHPDGNLAYGPSPSSPPVYHNKMDSHSQLVSAPLQSADPTNAPNWSAAPQATFNDAYYSPSPPHAQSDQQWPAGNSQRSAYQLPYQYAQAPQNYQHPA